MQSLRLLALRRRRWSGSILPLTVVLMVSLLAALGSVLYTGVTGYIQHLLQQWVNNVALVGAAAYYDGTTTQFPTADASQAMTAAQTVSDRILQNSGALRSFQAQLTTPIQVVDGSIRLAARAQLDTPFLAPIGLKELKVDARAMARPGRYVAVNPGQLDAARNQVMVTVQLPLPLVDGPGPDLRVVVPEGRSGYLLEACSGNTCYDLSGAAKPENPTTAKVSDGPLGSFANRRILYSSVTVDLGAVSGAYSGGVRKANRLRLIDDSLYDRISGGQRYLELVPRPLPIERVEVYHVGVLCPSDGVCTAPRNIELLPG